MRCMSDAIYKSSLQWSQLVGVTTNGTKQLKKDLSHFTVCKKLIEEDRKSNEALLLLRSEKYTTMFENVKQEFQRRFSDSAHTSLNLCCFPILFIAIRKVHLLICNWS